MENKKVTKLLLAEAGLRVPEGRDYSDAAAARADFAFWEGRSVVVKPNSTNFGIAVSLLPAPFAEREYVGAVEAALREDETILIEELVRGREYRLLVIGGETRAVLHRIPANVTGDGSQTIAALVNAKNSDPLRGKGYKSPLEKIRMGPEEGEYLRAQGLSLDSIPAAGARVFLRRNSNISTGGDSLDLTDSVHPGYHELAAVAAAAVGARICGVDMMIEDVERAPAADNYGIIELNFNPALHIHDFPYEGQNREVEKPVLDLLGL
jgi:glutamate--cysteine ligase